LMIAVRSCIWLDTSFHLVIPVPPAIGIPFPRRGVERELYGSRR